ncbi:hypothetical protein FDI64_gp06 [Mycobacterium phage Zemanar]|uniref:Uncharacterized protein n=2 Tax=Coopervirus TaxID=1982898 RepID=A0A7G8LFQ0_9CAUD|nr:hypothetical protein FDI64_gp06 [Mycobacterium phage Zemanar]YP_010109549.1 hypothetical protein KNV18_gp06 [Mycobacterium phage Heath]AEJ95681.1 hypothetical protein ZEMANAR_6 [Mycobacterium phage Zemanar]QNJ56072.1 hypothetical protein SEA_HEATH_6 [Mycobacterium phage Heath]
MEPARQRWLAERQMHRQQIRIQRATKFRVEVPVLLAELRERPQWWGDVIWDYVESFAESRGASDLVPSLRCVFVGGLDAAREADQAWFTDYISPGMVLICFEADAYLPPM